MSAPSLGVEIATLEWAGWLNNFRSCEHCGDMAPVDSVRR